MARPGLTRNRKFLRLARVLGGRAIAFGSLGLMWEVGYEAGDPRLGDSVSVESAADWQGEPGRLTAALFECGFIDETPNGFEIHDFWTHAPRYVRERAKRETEREERGVSISELRREAGRKGAEARWQAQGRHEASDDSRMATDCQLASTPSTQHAKDKIEPTLSSPAADATSSSLGLTLEQAIEVWRSACPHLPQPRPTAKRRRHLTARCRDSGFVESFRDVCERIGRSRFCAGESERGWRADLGWLLERPDAWVKVLEGLYDDKSTAKNSASPDASMLELFDEEVQ